MLVRGITKAPLFGRLEKYNEAIECFEQALEIDPKYARAWYSKGLAFYNLEKYNEAIECYDIMKSNILLVRIILKFMSPETILVRAITAKGALFLFSS